MLRNGKLQDDSLPARLQDAKELGKPLLLVLEIADAEGACDAVENAILVWKRFSVSYFQGSNCGCDGYCSRVWGCPGNIWDFEKNCAAIDEVVCVGCGACASICPSGAIKVEGGDE